MNCSATTAGHHRRRQLKRWRTGWLAGVFALANVQAALPHLDLFRRDYHPDNTFAYPAKLSLDFRRVAILPLTATTPGNESSEGCIAMTPVLLEQLVKSKKFEVVPVDATKLRRETGHAAWSSTETLPPDFLASLRREYGCDGVLFSELTVYKAYAPMEIGWRLKLVDISSGQIIWAVDEVFDATQPSVRRAAQKFDNQHFTFQLNHDDNWLALNSPRQFGRYSVTTLLGTLPDR